MSENTAKLFAENRDEISQSIAPADQTNMGLKTTSMMNAFQGAAHNSNTPPAPQAPSISYTENKLDKQDLARRAEDAGNCLQNMVPPKKQSDVAYGAVSVGASFIDVGREFTNLFSAKPIGPSDKSDNDNDLKQQAPTFANNTFRSGPGFGAGGLS